MHCEGSPEKEPEAEGSCPVLMEKAGTLWGMGGRKSCVSTSPLGRQKHQTGSRVLLFSCWTCQVKVRTLLSCSIMSDSYDPMDCSPQSPPSIVFSRQEYWSGLPFPAPGNLPHPGIKPRSPASQVGSLLSEPPGKPQVLYT